MPTLDDLLTVEEVAELLGVASSTLGEWCSRCQFPHRKLPGKRRILIPRADVEAYLDGADLSVKHLRDGGRIVEPRR